MSVPQRWTIASSIPDASSRDRVLDQVVTHQGLDLLGLRGQLGENADSDVEVSISAQRLLGPQCPEHRRQALQARCATDLTSSAARLAAGPVDGHQPLRQFTRGRSSPLLRPGPESPGPRPAEQWISRSSLHPTTGWRGAGMPSATGTRSQDFGRSTSV